MMIGIVASVKYEFLYVLQSLKKTNYSQKETL